MEWGWGGNKMRDQDMATGNLLPPVKIQLAHSTSFLNVMDTNKIQNPGGYACLDLSVKAKPEKRRHTLLSNMG